MLCSLKATASGADGTVCDWLSRRCARWGDQACRRCDPQRILAAIREDARRERLLDMQVLAPYRFACFGILAASLASVASEVGWWWVAPPRYRPRGFSVADRFMRTSAPPAVWAALAWVLPLLLADAVITTGGADSPALMWFALPAMARWGRGSDPRGIALGTVYILGLLLVSTVGLNTATASEHHRRSLLPAHWSSRASSSPAPSSSPTGPTGGARR